MAHTFSIKTECASQRIVRIRGKKKKKNGCWQRKAEKERMKLGYRKLKMDMTKWVFFFNLLIRHRVCM